MTKLIIPAVLIVTAGTYFSHERTEEVVAPAVAYEVSADVVSTTVSGRVVRVARDGRVYPAPQIPVNVTHPQYGPSQLNYTQLDGWYYIPNVPASRNRDDTYTLQVWLTQRDALRFNIVAFPQPTTVIADITVP